MIRIDLTYWVNTIETVNPFLDLQGPKSLGDIYGSLYLLYDHLERTDFYTKSTRVSANSLASLLAHYVENPDFSRELNEFEINSIVTKAKDFDVIFRTELKTLPAYLVTPKGGYDVDILTQQPGLAFPIDLLLVIPEVKYDVEEAAKCLAFDVPTAAGFHLHRLNEKVVHNYWDAISDGKKRPSRRDLGAYLKGMEQEKIGDRKIMAALQQIKDLHRNPVLHPQANLSTAEVIQLFGIINSVVSAMLPAIRKYKEEKSAISADVSKE